MVALVDLAVSGLAVARLIIEEVDPLEREMELSTSWRWILVTLSGVLEVVPLLAWIVRTGSFHH